MRPKYIQPLLRKHHASAIYNRPTSKTPWAQVLLSVDPPTAEDEKAGGEGGGPLHWIPLELGTTKLVVRQVSLGMNRVHVILDNLGHKGLASYW